MNDSVRMVIKVSDRYSLGERAHEGEGRQQVNQRRRCRSEEGSEKTNSVRARIAAFLEFDVGNKPHVRVRNTCWLR